MFKKPFTIGQSHKVSGADRKKLRRALDKAFGPLSEADLEALLPAKAGELECAKLASPSRIVLYLHDGAPLLIDPAGKGDLLPSVFALWRLPGLLPQVYVKHPAVSRYLVGGADLMLPGVLLPPSGGAGGGEGGGGGGLPAFQSGQLVAVCSPGNPAPLAVGRAVLGSAEAEGRMRGGGGRAGGGKGKLVEVVQHYGDHLWSDVGCRAVPNPGFLPDGVVPPGVVSIEAMLAQAGDSDDSEDSEEEGQQGEQQQGQDQLGDSGAAAADGASSAADQLRGLALGSAAVAVAGGSGGGGGGGREAEANAGEGAGAGGGGGEGGAGGVDMDALLESALLQALTKSVKDSDLPLNSSVLWNQHMLPARPAGCTLDVKRSKHKKMSKFLQSYGKLGLLTLKEDKHSGDVIVTSVNRRAPLYTEFRPYKAAATAAGAEAASSSSSAAAATPAAAAAVASSGLAAAFSSGGPTGRSSGPCEPLHIEEVFKPGKELRPLFEELGLNPEALYTAAEAAEVAFGYARVAGLEAGAPDNRTLLLNPTLCDALFKGFIKKGETYPTHLAKADLREAFMRRMHMQCRVTRGNQQVVRKGQPPVVQISTEKRQGNKRVTKVVGLEPFLVDLEQVAGECQRKFACSTNVVELPGKGAGHEVVLQGSFLDPVADFIMQQYGIPKKYFLVKK